MGVNILNRAIFLDRDGILNAVHLRHNTPCPPSSESEVIILPGVPEACRMLHASGFLLIVVTNQPDIARGTQSYAMVSMINRIIQKHCLFDDMFICPHDTCNHCDCRKPQPGLILKAAQKWKINLKQSFMVGDRWKDIAAGQNAGCTSILVGDGYGEEKITIADYTTTSLLEAAKLISERNYHA